MKIPTIWSHLWVSCLVVTIVSGAFVQLLTRDDTSSIGNQLDLSNTTTDTVSIANTIAVVNQKGGATDSAPPGQPPPKTIITAVDGTLTDAGAPSQRRSIALPGPLPSRASIRGLDMRQTTDDYDQVFAGTGTGPNDRDGAIEGTAYLTYTVVPNSTYNVDACLQYCDSVPGCVFANLYYEYNNELLDFVFSEKSNLKCVLYGDVHTAAEKTNIGGQQSIPAPAGLTYIQNSSGYASKKLTDPAIPSGFELVFGPTEGANNALGYMGFVFLDRYDVDTCAKQCIARGPDPNGGTCQYFNIWRAVVNGVPTTYTCSMYFTPTNESTAVNTGQGNLQVTLSRGYTRINYLPGGDFEFYADCTEVCYTERTPLWLVYTPPNGHDDAIILYLSLWAHGGHSLGMMGSRWGLDAMSGILSPNSQIKVTPGKKYIISFFHAGMAGLYGPEGPGIPYVDVYWNGIKVQTFTPGLSPWKYREVLVTAINGFNALAFEGGGAGGILNAWSLIDDIGIFEAA